MRIALTIEGAAEFDRTFTRYTEQLQDLRPLWPGVIVYMRAVFVAQYAGEGIGRSGKWKPLSKPYARRKAKQYPGKTILRRTDRTYKSLTGRTGDTIERKEAQFLEMGSSVPYVMFHQSTRPRRKIPRRPVLDLNPQQQNELMRVIHRRLLTAPSGQGVQL